jgi:NAD(P)-dependent dehydrogenase (short-subunit alcohol dehydrogenase family)
MNLAECVFLITGGSSGLGGAAAAMALEAGARVVIADRVAPREDSPLRIIDPKGERWIWQETDVSDDTQGSAAVYLAQDRFGRLDVLVNAAGIAFAEKLYGREGPHQLASFQKVIQVNLLGSFNMMRLAVPVMHASPPRPGFDVDGKEVSRGVIVNTASVAAFDGQIGQVAYAASKGGIAAMTLPAARDLARDRIRVVTVAPGIFATPMMAGMPPDVQKALAAGVPNPARLGRPDEYSALVRHIVENDYLNGEVIRLDGALRMAPR